MSTDRSQAQLDSQAIHDLLALDRKRILSFTHTRKLALPHQNTISCSGSARRSKKLFEEMVKKRCRAGLIEVKGRVLFENLPRRASSLIEKFVNRQANVNPKKSEPSTSKVPTTSSPILSPIALPTSTLDATHSDEISSLEDLTPPIRRSSNATAESPDSVPIPESLPPSHFSEDTSSPQRPIYNIRRQPQSNKGRQQLHSSVLRLAPDATHLKLHFNFPGHGRFSSAGRSYSEAAAALFTKLRQKGLVTKNP